jgi:hypothetical protein
MTQSPEPKVTSPEPQRADEIEVILGFDRLEDALEFLRRMHQSAGRRKRRTLPAPLREAA